MPATDAMESRLPDHWPGGAGEVVGHPDLARSRRYITNASRVVGSLGDPTTRLDSAAHKGRNVAERSSTTMSNGAASRPLRFTAVHR